ncbi:MAG: FliH/SctL family protein [Planctomycetota bacterium]|jgi:flagellar biosynthesis/type III secretory pathway protein FliH
MSQTLTVNLNKPIASARFLDDHVQGDNIQSPSPDIEESGAGATQIQNKDLEAQKAVFSQACQTLNGVIAKLNQFCEKLYAGHREEIARLSVEIARKILMQKVENGDYEMESVIKEALKNAPGSQDVIVHLNPEDIEKCRKAQKDRPGNVLAGIKLIPDPNIGRAECLLESPKGIIKLLIDDSLERISKALGKAN